MYCHCLDFVVACFFVFFFLLFVSEVLGEAGGGFLPAGAVMLHTCCQIVITCSSWYMVYSAIPVSPVFQLVFSYDQTLFLFLHLLSD